ncbi:RES domain-containing protein [Streptomyces sp. OspMP-M43]|uniref:RES domain-containing protein n=1 Tax=Streptomyces sp. OspMP-M43 TaxID=1839781 RepID=UPI00081AFCCA|nr:RES domain-containing protein [Streptomyces sp. OspMP-M43]
MTGGISPAAYVMRPREHVIEAGTVLWRVHSGRRPATGFNPVSADAHFGGNRFDGTTADPYPYLYLADDPAAALAETLLRSLDFDPATSTRLVPYAAVRGRFLTPLVTRADLRLVSLIGEEDLAAVCQDSWLLESEGDDRYAKTRRWCSEIRSQAPGAMGLVWQSRRMRPRLATVIFEDRCGTEPLVPLHDAAPAHGAPDAQGGGDVRDLGAGPCTPQRAVVELGLPTGVAEVNRLLAPLRAAVVPPWPE